MFVRMLERKELSFVSPNANLLRAEHSDGSSGPSNFGPFLHFCSEFIRKDSRNTVKNRRPRGSLLTAQVPLFCLPDALASQRLLSAGEPSSSPASLCRSFHLSLFVWELKDASRRMKAWRYVAAIGQAVGPRGVLKAIRHSGSEC